MLLPDRGGKFGAKGFDAKIVEQFIQERYREAMEKLEQSRTQCLSDATISFASIAVQLSELLAPLVPQSPEYTIPFGCLMIVFEVAHCVLEQEIVVLTEIDLGCKTRKARKSHYYLRFTSTKVTITGFV